MANTSHAMFVRMVMSRCGAHVDQSTTLGCTMSFYLLRTCPFLLLLVGTIGNLLNVIVLSRQRMRQKSTTVYLLSLAVSDLITLWTTLLRSTWLLGWSKDIRNLSGFTCATQELIASSGAILSVLLLVLISMERMLVTKYPVLAKRRMTRRNALMLTVMGVVFSIGVSIHLSLGKQFLRIQIKMPNNITVYLPKRRCTFVSEAYTSFFYDGWSLIGIAINMLSMALIVICNTVIITTLTIQRRRVQPIGPTGLVQLNQTSRDRPLTILTVLLALYFMITTLPYTIYRYIMATLPSDLPDEQFSYYIFGFLIIYYVALSNLSLNFFFYFGSGPVFKRELKAMWLGFCRTPMRLVDRTALQLTHPDSVETRSTSNRTGTTT